MESLSINEWIALISSIGTFFSSIFVLVTLFELRTQRKQSYIPELVIPDVCFNYNNEFPNYIKIWAKDDDEMLSLKVHNIGRGVAKHIDFEWEYDIHGMIEQFYKLKCEDKGEIFIDTDENRLYHQKNNEVLAGSSLSSDNRHVDFMLSHHDGAETYNLELPNSYICISTAIFKSAKTQEVFDLQRFDGALFPLTLIAKYKDIGGSEIKKNFKVEVKFFVKSINLRVLKSDKISEMRGRVYISEK
ncbi:hypothetical protein AB4538_09880 [Vibrio lentus]